MYIVSKDEMRRLDSLTMSEYFLPSRVLMENAGKGCADIIHQKKFGVTVLVVCGVGNNGGDGFVVARWLYKYGYDVSILVVGDKQKFSSETAENYKACEKLGLKILDNSDYSIGFDLIVDALLGIGFRGTLEGELKEMVELINFSFAKIVSIDIPSGLGADNGLSECCVHADLTLTMAAAKPGHFLGRGKEVCGELMVVPIGIPDSELSDSSDKFAYLDEQILPVRSPVAHKGTYGNLAIVAGSAGYSGAAVLCSRSALHSGAGLITLYHPKGMEEIFEMSLTEVMTRNFDFLDRAKTADAVLIGPGLGTQNVEVVEFILDNFDGKLIIDADGLNTLAENRELLKKVKGAVLTPHIGEFARLCGKTSQEVLQNPIGLLKNFVAEFGCKVLLKSHVSLFCSGAKIWFINKGNDGLATGGSGDVLAGAIASFAAQGLDLDSACLGAAHLVGDTAEKLATKFATPAITPSRIIENFFRL